MFSLFTRAVDAARFWWKGGDADTATAPAAGAAAAATVDAATVTAPVDAHVATPTIAKGRKRKASPHQTAERRSLRSAAAAPADEQVSPSMSPEKITREKKQLLSDQITGMLVDAGWTVERRPRSKRAYSDAVYVDAAGKTHWSVTRAYEKLAEKIENGTADEKESAAFSPVPAVDQLRKKRREW